jgi:uncharacterized protein (DUF305 family)
MRLMLAAAMLSLAACSQSGSDSQSGPRTQSNAGSGATAPDRVAMTPAQAAYAEANDRMHGAMGNIPADADVAFVQGMIPHHQGAIDMARIVLEHGTDPENRRLAQAIITAQETEIAQMRAWLERRGVAAAIAPATDAAPVDHSKMGH